jgi:diaminopimelate epimerase
MTIQLTKVHGSDNDFFIFDVTQLATPLTEAQLSQVAQHLTDRETGLAGGADGVLVVDHSQHAGVAGKMRVINADGSEASMCGNGIRTVARYLSEKTDQTAFKIETMYADLAVQQAPEIATGIATYQAEISPVCFGAQELGLTLPDVTSLRHKRLPLLSKTLYFTAVAVPNPHLISFVDHETLLGPELGRIAGYLNNGTNTIFPDGVNVTFVEVLGQNHIFARTFERGVGFTNACGTGMSAASLIYVLEQGGIAEKPITVRNPGGMVQTIVHQKADGAYWMDLIGNATFVGTVELTLDQLLTAPVDQLTLQETGEQTTYRQFVAQLAEA